MRMLLLAGCALGAVGCLLPPTASNSPVPHHPKVPEPIGITAALLMDARFIDERPVAAPAGRDGLPVPPAGKGPAVVIGDARDAAGRGARYYVPVETLRRTTALTLAAPARELSPRAVWRRRDHFRIVDLRESGEFAASRVPGSERRSMFSDFRQSHRPIALFCLTGHRSAAVVMQLREQGVRNVYSVRGGWLDWQKQRLPLQEVRGGLPIGGYISERR